MAYKLILNKEAQEYWDPSGSNIPAPTSSKNTPISSGLNNISSKLAPIFSSPAVKKLLLASLAGGVLGGGASALSVRNIQGRSPADRRRKKRNAILAGMLLGTGAGGGGTLAHGLMTGSINLPASLRADPAPPVKGPLRRIGTTAGVGAGIGGLAGASYGALSEAPFLSESHLGASLRNVVGDPRSLTYKSPKGRHLRAQYKLLLNQSMDPNKQGFKSILKRIIGQYRLQSKLDPIKLPKSVIKGMGYGAAAATALGTIGYLLSGMRGKNDA